MVYAMIAIGALGFVVWAHHMYTVRMSVTPTSIFYVGNNGYRGSNWDKNFFMDCYNVWGGSVEFKTPMLWAIGFLFLFTVGGVTGIVLSQAGIDRAYHDTYYVVLISTTSCPWVQYFVSLREYITGLVKCLVDSILDGLESCIWLMFIGSNITFSAAFSW